MPSKQAPPHTIFRTDLLGWLCFLTLLIANVCNSSAPAESEIRRAAGYGGAAYAQGPPCPSDIAPPGGDGHVNVLDLLAIISDWGPCPKDPPPVCDPSGQWVHPSAVSYTCAFGIFSYNISGWQFSQAGDTLSVQPIGSGNLLTMSGPAADCQPGNSFTVSATEPGSCSITFTLTGTFTTENQFTGTFTVSFAGGFCQNCTTQTYNITATR